MESNRHVNCKSSYFPIALKIDDLNRKFAIRKSTIAIFVILEMMKNRIKRKYFWIKLFTTNEQSTNSESHTKKK